MTVNVTDQPLGHVVNLVARRLGADVKRQGDLFYVGTFKPQDRAILVRRSPRLTVSELNQAIGSMASQGGQSVVTADGLVIVSDRIDVLDQVHTLIDELDRAEVTAWVVQLYLITVTDEQLSELGLDLTPKVDLAAAFTATSFAAGGPSMQLNAEFESLLQAARVNATGSLVADPLLYCLDGQRATYRKGLVLSYEQKAVSDQGTVTTTGFQNIEVGLNVTAQVRELGQGMGLLTVDLTSSELTEDGRPIPTRKEERYSSAAPVNAGGCYLLGHVRRDTMTDEGSTWLQPGFRQGTRCETLMIWARVERVSTTPLPQTHRQVEQLPAPPQA